MKKLALVPALFALLTTCWQSALADNDNPYLLFGYMSAISPTIKSYQLELTLQALSKLSNKGITCSFRVNAEEYFNYTVSKENINHPHYDFMIDSKQIGKANTYRAAQIVPSLLDIFFSQTIINVDGRAKAVATISSPVPDMGDITKLHKLPIEKNLPADPEKLPLEEMICAWN